MGDSVLKKKKYKPFAYFIVFFAGIGGILYGYDIGVISGALIYLKTDFKLSDVELSSIVAAVLGGGAIATLITGYLADRFGRRTMISTAGFIFIVGVVYLLFAQNYIMILTARLVQGIGVGIVTIIIPLYLAEAAPTAIRGRAVTVFQLFLTGGILLAFVIDLAFAHSGNWRGMFACVLVPGFILFIGSFYLIKSPRWLYSKGKKQLALQMLYRTLSEEEAVLDLKEMQQTHLEKADLSLRQFFQNITEKKFLTPFLIALAIACLNQLTGINSILQFSTYILSASGLSSNFISMLGSVGVGLTNFIVTIIAVSLIDRVGRKPLLMLGTAGAVVALITTGFLCLMTDSPLKGGLISIGLFFFILFYAIGPGVVVWLALSELLPTVIRSKGMAICLFVNSTVSAILASVFLSLVHVGGYQSVFWLCGGFTILYFWLARTALPETKNQSLEEIEMCFDQEERNK